MDYKDEIFSIESLEETDEDEKAEFLNICNRGGLKTPSHIMYLVTLFAHNFFEEVMTIPELRKALENATSAQALFVGAAVQQMETDVFTMEILKEKCEEEHEFKIIVKQA